MGEIANLQAKEREVRRELQACENMTHDLRDQLRTVTAELDTRTAENDHLVSVLEDLERKLDTFEAKEKTVQGLAAESKKRLEEANSERDRVLLKE